MPRSFSAFLAVILILAPGAAIAPGAAVAQGTATHTAEYRIAFLGLSVARASFLTLLDGDDFRIAGEMRSAGVGGLIGQTSGSATVSGAVTEDRLQADHYLVTYASGGEEQLMEVRFERGNVVAARLTPEKTRSRRDWVPTDETDLSGVLDPVAGLIVPVTGRPCDRIVPLFDGETRLDLYLNEAGTRPFSTDGFSGEAVVCTARAEPKSGYHAEKSTIRYLRTMTAEVWFAPNDEAGIMAPVYARIPTSLGPVTVTATRFGP